MKKTLFRLSCLLLWTSLLVAKPLSSAAVPDNPPIPAQALAPVMQDGTVTTPTFLDAVNQLMKQIAGQQGFEAWKQASWTSYPLGPGQHGWIVLLKAGGAEVGYMVIYADPDNPDKYKLAEYGSGSAPLFSLNTLYQSLVQLELIDTSYKAERWYADPFHAVWLVSAGEQNYYIDAKTGQPLPLSSVQELQDASLAAAPPPRIGPDHTVAASLQTDAFDPYDRLPWVKGQAVSFSRFELLAAAIKEQRKLTFVAELYGRTVTLPLAVTGYHRWSDEEAFLLLDQDGPRAVSYAAVSAAGRLFP
ncbi:hypothetical protein SK3146_01900 [Paenibacillus konkukensis]|uniref:Uncharacterized protein n=1 Tax=Paenibacillus konkukensis TaxID=2020716 RepID=A0ABY4RJV2_9BACL|nr:hypothetical protein [Paenibacillus konkukensis]UQZ82741.1 hypothetical protein SK3146_01900 [Paenibacillus konkukensis]